MPTVESLRGKGENMGKGWEQGLMVEQLMRVTCYYYVLVPGAYL